MDLSKIFLKDACPTSIGGQSIMEGIMMRGPERTATAMRLPDGRIYMKTQPSPKMGKWRKVPLVRGVISFISSLVNGTKVLMDSANVLEKYYPDDYEESKFDNWVENKIGKEKAWTILLVISVALALVMSVGIFMLVPTAVVSLFTRFIHSSLLLNLIEGVIRMLIFIAYIALIALMPDIKTTFQYHGAEHKTIHCFENNLELTPKNAQQFYTLHPRCGTSFMVFVLIIAVLVHALMGWPSMWLRLTTRILILPVIAGLAYELLKWAGRSSNPIVKVLSIPGLYVQKLTTREPSDEQLEVAIAAMKAVLKPADTPYFEGICDLDGNPVEETSDEESSSETSDEDETQDNAAAKGLKEEYSI